ncbi:MAG: hypothetical protein GY731_19000, partial [Gammaproteobacteria bacterium]|nr:hypothetical protein [Gammaproteobacteria bacterium]
MKKIHLISLFLMSLLITACIDIQTLVQVKRDGSGTVEERMLMSGMVGDLAAQMQKQLGDNSGPGQLYSEADLRQRAGKMGEGVRLLSVDELRDGKRKGYHAIFAFDDITKVTVNQNPAEKIPSQPGMNITPRTDKKEFVTFGFTPGPTSELTIRTTMDSPVSDQGKGSQQQSKPEGSTQNLSNPMAQEMMKQFFQDMRIALAVEVEGSILETNATYREGSRITLMELDFGKLLGDMDKFQQFTQQNPESITDAMHLMQSMEGIKAELEPNIRIRFGGSPIIREARQLPEERQPVPAVVSTAVPVTIAPPEPVHTVVSTPAPVTIAPPVPVHTVVSSPAPVTIAPPVPVLTVVSTPVPVTIAPPVPVHTVVSTPVPVTIAPPVTPAGNYYRWREIDPLDAGQHIRKLVQVGKAKGMLMEVSDESLVLKQTPSDGGKLLRYQQSAVATMR